MGTQRLLDVLDGLGDDVSVRAPLLAEERRLLIAAMGRAQDVLLQAEWQTAQLADVVRGALHMIEDGRVTLDGPPVTISGRQTLSLALAVHELATNAAKYGALSGPEGTVRITWEAGHPGSEQPFRFVWTEQGGPPVIAPERTGFGSQLIGRALPAHFHGTATIAFEPSGLCFTLDTRMNRLGEHDHA